MPRPPGADEAGGLYHALNRGNLQATIFHKEQDFEAFEQILHEALQIHEVELFAFQVIPNHYQLVVCPQIDGEMSLFMGWVGGTHTMRYHAHYHTSGTGNVYQQRYKSFPIQDDDHFFAFADIGYVERYALWAGLVEHAEQWRWGSQWRWVHKPVPHPPLLSPCPMLRLPGWVGRSHSRRRNWRRSDNRRSVAGHLEMSLGGVDRPLSQSRIHDASWGGKRVRFPQRRHERGLTRAIIADLVRRVAKRIEQSSEAARQQAAIEKKLGLDPESKV